MVQQIRNLIQKGKLKQGDQLPTERELVDTFKVSRASVREAIRYLESMKFVESRQGDGTYMIASSEEALIQPLAATLFLEKDNIMDIFSIRKIIEPQVAQLVAENATASEINELEEILQEQAKDLGDGINFTKTDSEFHNLLTRTAKNRVLERFLLAVLDLLAQTREKYLQVEGRAQKSLKGHQEILSAIKARNPVAARQAMRRHLEEIEHILFNKKKGGVKRSSTPTGRIPSQ
ncbi:MAG: FadR/GntR family transcriptional regulator [Deltaproteobacteria bacterium]|nr:FadR/GntR family transcriptional regulator [Deltaproteobacteria bacterium]